MGDMYQNVNIYDNTILVFGKSFPSPISDNALLFYKFYLIDSMVIDGHKCYQLQFKPKRKQELTFTGNLWAADTSFAVKQIEMSIADDANINFINSTAVVQTYQQVEDSVWMMQRERLVIDFNPFPVDRNKKKTVMDIIVIDIYILIHIAHKLRYTCVFNTCHFTCFDGFVSCFRISAIIKIRKSFGHKHRQIRFFLNITAVYIIKNKREGF